MYANKKIEARSSGIEGTGLFAARDLKQGERIASIQGPTCFKVNKTMQDVLGHPNWVGFKKNYWLAPACPCVYLNHSCNPNAGIKGKRLVYALRNIKKGEEICFDYSTTEVEPRWVAPWTCHCGQKQCRKQIRSVEYLPEKIVQSYIPFIPTGVQYYYDRIKTKRVRK